MGVGVRVAAHGAVRVVDLSEPCACRAALAQVAPLARGGVEGVLGQEHVAALGDEAHGLQQ